MARSQFCRSKQQKSARQVGLKGAANECPRTTMAP